MIRHLNEAPVVTIPEINSALDMEMGEAITNSSVRPARSVTILVLHVPAAFLTRRGLRKLGPQYAGIDIAIQPALKGS